MMTREEAKKIFLSRGFIKADRGNGVFFDGNKWREACLVISEWLKEEPKSEWEQDHTILKAYSDGANDMLDKIRAEIESDWQLKKYPSSPFSCGLRRAIEVIDKYKGESEGEK